MRKRYTLAVAQEIFEAHGCKLLENQYVNDKTPMKYICVCKIESKTTLKLFLRGSRCKKCGYEKQKNHPNVKKAHAERKYTFEYVYNCFKEKGCTLLENEYKDIHQTLKYICSCGNVNKIAFQAFQKREKCVCQKYTFEYVYNFFKEKGCTLLENEYKNNHYLMNYICDCGETSKTTFIRFRKGHRCKKCGHKKLRKPNYKNRKPNAKINAKFRQKCKRMLSSTLSATGKIKNTKTSILLGYGVKELKEHIITHSNWEHVKDVKWHLDHIFPISAFVAHNILDLKIINALDNLQPLEAVENMKKHDDYNKEDFYMWLAYKGIILPDCT